ncbi:hypothetical protein [Bowmanella dokdonensis]|uniref:Uncharacterized protein n=1 Tax=Bowmanella dokdonensis TaxID=751969 RepID=A0A939DPE9_9ALTE|nr:hypothetical protein [Bowmanella dokdonensis]MBN7826340.1 hypothetical protein [Bowmanella dokdonensis]
MPFIEDINRELTALNVPIKMNDHSLLWEIRRLFLLSVFFKLILKFKGTKKLIVICYYNHISLAACKAANEMGIETIEYQHGMQNKYQPMYNTWFNVPREGYVLLPKVFAVWSQYNIENLNSWILKSDFHSARLVGNGFSTFYANEIITTKSYTDVFGNYSKKILITLQSERYFPRFLPDVIQNSPKDWLWILKEHPNHKILNVPGIDLEKLKCRHNVIWETKLHLYALLPEVDLHATAFSTAAFEALEFNVPTIFFDPVAESCFGSLVQDNEYFSCASSEEEFVTFIRFFMRLNIRESKSVFHSFDGEAIASPSSAL